jgi:solute carrier family 25 carnitine/acylcarnitine transporter 20/29
MGLQFLFTGVAKKYLSGHGGQDGHGHLSAKSDFMAAGVGGLLSSFFTTPVEMVMIQQQKFGGSFIGTTRSIIKTHGVTNNGIMRGLMGAASRDAIYVSGMLAVTPLVREYLIENYDTPHALAGLYASLLGGVCAAVPSHPFDVIKTCMQVSFIYCFVLLGLHLLHGR